MALRFLDSFDHYAAADIFKKWSTSYTGTFVTLDPSLSAGNGRHSSACARWAVTGQNSAGRALAKVVPASGATAVWSFAFKQSTGAFSALGTGSPANNTVTLTANSINALCALRHSTQHYTNTAVYFAINASGTITAWAQTTNIASGVAGWTNLGTTSVALTANAWQSLQFKVVLSTTTTGSVGIKLDGVSVLNVTGIVTVYSGYSAVWDEVAIGHNVISGAGGSVTWDFDDVAIGDGSGSYNNDYLGDLRVDALFPNAAGNSNMSTPSTGVDRSATVDEASANGDTDYNTLAAVSDKDTYAFTNCPVSGAPVSGVQVGIWAKTATAGSCGVKPIERSSGTDYLGTTEKGVPSDYIAVLSVHDRSIVDNTTAWSTAEIDAAEFGVQKTT